MSEGIKIYFDEDGIAKEYDDTYDITIHCESEEEQNELLDRLNRQWIPVSERLPENHDDVLVWVEYIKDDYDCAWWALAYYSRQHKKWVVSTNGRNPIVKAWMPLPEPYKASPTGAEMQKVRDK